MKKALLYLCLQLKKCSNQETDYLTRERIYKSFTVNATFYSASLIVDVNLIKKAGTQLLLNASENI